MRRLVTICLASLLMSCAATGGVTPASSPRAEELARPAWLDVAGAEIEAVRECIRARSPEAAVAVHVQALNDLRVGVVTLALDGSAERCVYRMDHVEWRVRARELNAAEFAGHPAVTPGRDRPVWAGDAYLEELVSEGRTVAWVHWLGGAEAGR